MRKLMRKLKRDIGRKLRRNTPALRARGLHTHTHTHTYTHTHAVSVRRPLPRVAQGAATHGCDDAIMSFRHSSPLLSLGAALSLSLSVSRCLSETPTVFLFEKLPLCCHCCELKYKDENAPALHPLQPPSPSSTSSSPPSLLSAHTTGAGDSHRQRAVSQRQHPPAARAAHPEANGRRWRCSPVPVPVPVPVPARRRGRVWRVGRLASAQLDRRHDWQQRRDRRGLPRPLRHAVLAGQV